MKSFREFLRRLLTKPHAVVPSCAGTTHGHRTEEPDLHHPRGLTPLTPVHELGLRISGRFDRTRLCPVGRRPIGGWCNARMEQGRPWRPQIDVAIGYGTCSRRQAAPHNGSRGDSANWLIRHRGNCCHAVLAGDVPDLESAPLRHKMRGDLFPGARDVIVRPVGHGYAQVVACALCRRGAGPSPAKVLRVR